MKRGKLELKDSDTLQDTLDLMMGNAIGVITNMDI